MTTLHALLFKIISVINIIIPYLIAFGLIIFLIGVLRYAFSGDENTQTESKGLMIYGIIALFVMVSVWGLVNLLVNFFTPFSGSGSNVVSPKNIPYQNLKP